MKKQFLLAFLFAALASGPVRSADNDDFSQYVVLLKKGAIEAAGTWLTVFGAYCVGEHFAFAQMYGMQQTRLVTLFERYIDQKGLLDDVFDDNQPNDHDLFLDNTVVGPYNVTLEHSRNNIRRPDGTFHTTNDIKNIRIKNLLTQQVDMGLSQALDEIGVKKNKHSMSASVCLSAALIGFYIMCDFYES